MDISILSFLILYLSFYNFLVFTTILILIYCVQYIILLQTMETETKHITIYCIFVWLY